MVGSSYGPNVIRLPGHSILNPCSSNHIIISLFLAGTKKPGPVITGEPAISARRSSFEEATECPKSPMPAEYPRIFPLFSIIIATLESWLGVTLLP